MAKKITVLIVDDSAFIRNLFAEMLGTLPDIEVLGTANDALDARAKIKQLNPDVVTLDIEMPGMNGIEFLKTDEKAVGSIVDTVSSIDEYCSGLGLTPEAMSELGDRFMKIYELSGFQDISGQRVKKVLGHLDAMSSQLESMHNTARQFVRLNEYVSIEDQHASLLNGPPLADDVPTQEEIDRIFASL